MSADLLTVLQHDINCLGDDNRGTRKRALESLRKRLLSGSDKPTPEVLQETFEGALAKPLFRLFNDPVEKCRELSVDLIDDCCDAIPAFTRCLPYAVPAILARVGTTPVQEPTEEIRLKLVEFVGKIVDKCAGHISDYLDDLIAIVQKSLADQYPDMKKAASVLVGKLCATDAEKIGKHGATMAKAVMQNFSHQHAKIRQLSVQAIEHVVLAAHNDVKMIEEVLQNLKKLSYDKHHSVRQGIVQVATTWHRQHAESARFEDGFLILLLCGVADEHEGVAQFSKDQLSALGKEYEVAHQDDDIMCDKEQENWGCKQLICKNLEKMFPPLLAELAEWKANTRLRSASLLYHITSWAGSEVVVYLDKILPSLIRTCRDDEEIVAVQVLNCAKTIGGSTDPDAYLSILLPELARAGSTPNARTNAAIVLTSCIAGASSETIKPYLPRIIPVLQDPELCQAESVDLQQEVLFLTESVIKSAGENCREASEDLFWIVLQLQSVLDNEDLREDAAATMADLAEAEGRDEHALYEEHFGKALARLTANVTTWHKHSFEAAVFDTLVSNAGPVINDHVDAVLAAFEECLQLDKEWELKRNMLFLLNRVLGNEEIVSTLSPHAPRILKGVLIPSAIWRPGRIAACVRLMCSHCLKNFTQHRIPSCADLLTAMDDLLPSVITMMEDDYNTETRLVILEAVNEMLQITGGNLDYDNLRKIMPELLKRLDDSQDNIRLHACKTISTFLGCFPEGVKKTFYGNFEYMARILMVHSDDSSDQIQTAVMAVLQDLVSLCPEGVSKEATGVRGKHRNPQCIDELILKARGLMSS